MTVPQFPEERACRGADWRQFFPDTESPHSQAVQDVKARYCLGCPGRAACLEWALDTKSDWGIFGGLTGEERKPLRKARRRFAPTVPKRKASK